MTAGAEALTTAGDAASPAFGVGLSRLARLRPMTVPLFLEMRYKFASARRGSARCASCTASSGRPGGSRRRRRAG